MKNRILTVIALYGFASVNVVQAHSTLNFTVYNDSKTEKYQIDIKSFYWTGVSTRHDQASNIILNHGDRYTYSKRRDGYMGLEYIKVKNVNDPLKHIEFTKKKREEYSPESVNITENSDGYPQLKVTKFDPNKRR
jgi:hypothetical protein